MQGLSGTSPPTSGQLELPTVGVVGDGTVVFAAGIMRHERELPGNCFILQLDVVGYFLLDYVQLSYQNIVQERRGLSSGNWACIR